VRTRLPLDFVSQAPESAGEHGAITIARNLHAARTSSRM
jgi:hypothetical protein